MAGRYSQLSRFYHVLKLLEEHPRGLTAQAVLDQTVDDFPVTKRSIYRDLEALVAAGFPVEKDSEKRDVKWLLKQKLKIDKPIAFSAREVLALTFASQQMEWLKLTPFFSDIKSALRKARNLIPAQSRDYLLELAKTSHVRSGPLVSGAIGQELMDAIQASLDECQLLSVVYDSQNSTKRRRVLAPEFLYSGKGALYLVALDQESKELKTFSLSRMTKPELQDEIYQPRGIKPDLFFQSAMGVFSGTNQAEEVRLRFAPQLAKYISERQWHPSQRSVKNSDGTTTLTLRVDPNSEFTAWVLSFGSKVRVLSPAALQQRIKKEVSAMADAFD